VAVNTEAVAVLEASGIQDMSPLKSATLSSDTERDVGVYVKLQILEPTEIDDVVSSGVLPLPSFRTTVYWRDMSLMVPVIVIGIPRYPKYDSDPNLVIRTGVLTEAVAVLEASGVE